MCDNERAAGIVRDFETPPGSVKPSLTFSKPRTTDASIVFSRPRSICLVLLVKSRPPVWLLIERLKSPGTADRPLRSQDPVLVVELVEDFAEQSMGPARTSFGVG
jgi:hypothetical protein